MQATNDVLISVHARFADEIFSGRKTIELRRRKIRAQKGSRVWLYCTAPSCEIRGFIVVAKIVTGSTEWMWRNYGSRAGIAKCEFDAYFSGVQIAHGIVFERVHTARRIPSLREIRAKAKLCPPQFYRKLKSDEVEFLLKAIA